MKVSRDPQSPSGVLLVLNGAGGVGSMLIQLANRLTNLSVIATASRPESAEWVRKLGARHVADHSKPIDEALNAIGFDAWTISVRLLPRAVAHPTSRVR